MTPRTDTMAAIDAIGTFDEMRILMAGQARTGEPGIFNLIGSTPIR